MRLCNLVASWTAESPDAARDLLLRAFILYSSRIENQEAFLDALYGHEAWQEAQYCHSVRKLHYQKLELTLQHLRIV